MLTFGEFLDAELDGLVRYAAVLTGDRDQAHEALADALEKTQHRWDRIGRMDYPAAYVRRIVTSMFLSQRRRWSARMIRPTRSGELPERATADRTHVIDDRAEIVQLLAELPARQRVVVVLGYYLGLSNAEIATELGITAGAVRTAHSEAMRRLRIAVDAQESGGYSARDVQESPDSALPGMSSYLSVSDVRKQR